MAKDIFEAIKERSCFYKKNDGSIISLCRTSYETDFKKLVSDACNFGYSVFAERMIGENSFATLVGNGKTINVSYVPSEGDLRIVCEPLRYLPTKDENRERKDTKPFVAQIRCSNLKNNAGMAYVIRLCDGRFILIDGGYDEYDAAKDLVEFLERHNKVYEKPVIAAIFITHSHDDHLGVITRVLKEYRERIVLGDFIYNWPDQGLCNMSSCCEHGEFDSILQSIPEARTICARTGHSFCYADATFDILMCPDEFYPEIIDKFNESSLVMKMTLCGHEVLWMGDSGIKATEKLLRRYNREIFKCRILQVTHHGYGGSNPELDGAADPSILLWPAPDYWYREVREWKHNSFLKESHKIERTYVSGNGNIIIDFSCDSLPLLYDRDGEGDNLKNHLWDFKRTSSDITAVMAKKNGLVGADMSFSEEGCILKPVSCGVVLLEILTPDMMNGMTSFKFSCKGEKINDETKFGIAFNIPRPTVWSGENYVNFISEALEFYVNFYVCGEKKEVYAEINGVKFSPIKYDPEIKSGLYLALTEGSVLLKYAEIQRLDADN